MADSKITLQYDLKQNNAEGKPTYELWYPRAVRRSTLSLRGLSNHIADHGSIYTPDVVYGVLTKFKNCLIELVSTGVAVKLDGLGIFYPTLESKGAETPIKYNAAEYVKGIHIRFRPDGISEDDITSRTFMEKCSLAQRMLFDKAGVPKKVKNGQLVDYGVDDDDEEEQEEP